METQVSIQGILTIVEGVGKSCIVQRLTQDVFKSDHQITIGVEFGAFVMKIEGKLVKLQIWDTAG